MKREVAFVGKRRVDGTRSDTRIGEATTERWTNERFRQVLLLILEFRREWPNQSLLTADDVGEIRTALDSALYFATSNSHTADSEASLVPHSNPGVLQHFGCLRVRAARRAPHITHPPALLDRLRLKSNLLGNLARAKADLDQEGRLACRDGGNEAISLIRISLQLARRTARAWTPTPSGRRNDWSSSAPLQTPVQTHASTACPHVPVSVQESCQEAQ